MAWLVINKNGLGLVYRHKPERVNDNYWEDKETYFEIRKLTTCAEDYSHPISKETVKKISGKDMTWNDEPIEI